MNFFLAAAELMWVGLKVFPLVPGKNVPLIEAWPDLASDDEDVLAEWTEKWPDANVGVATGDISGVLVLDLDVKDGRNGMDDLAALAKRGKVLPPCPIALTPSGGRHLYFRSVPGVRNVVGVTASGRGIAPGVDVRSYRGYVVGPPSVVSKGSYRWLVPPMTPDFPRLPEWATKMLLPPPVRPRPASATDARGGDLEGAARCVAGTPQGRRHDVLFWAACVAGELVVKKAMKEGDAIKRLSDAAASAGMTALEVAEEQRTIRDGLERGGRDGGQ